jgi:hypothetical protein
MEIPYSKNPDMMLYSIRRPMGIPMSILAFSVDYLYVNRRLHLNPGSVATTHGKSIVDFDLPERLYDINAIYHIGGLRS